MMDTYIKRHAEGVLKKAVKTFGAVLVTGARQTGKTTLLTEGISGYRYVTLDDPIKLKSALNEGSTFFEENPPPVIIDEIQYAPGLFPYIKMTVDKTHGKGLFLMSGSQQFQMMKNVSESLAGRIAIVTLSGLSLREIDRINFMEPFLPEDTYFKARTKKLVSHTYDELWVHIHRGSMPALYGVPSTDWELFYSTYVKTYIERDVRDLSQVRDEQRFLAFMTIVAGRTGQLLNLSSIAQDTGISVPTADRWLSILITSNLVYLLRPFHINTSKRMVKAPKLYFLDTGLSSYLTQWASPQVLRNGAMAGPVFETFVVSEIIKSYYNSGKEPPVYFYRDRDGKEIDVLLWRNGKLYPLEIKKHANPAKQDIAAFPVLDKITGFERGSGGVICIYPDLTTMDGNDRVIPVWYL
ncbi:ATPase [Spirochaetia bacterium]|nr:ATPase [Spirochaetia bacterium]